MSFQRGKSEIGRRITGSNLPRVRFKAIRQDTSARCRTAWQGVARYRMALHGTLWSDAVPEGRDATCNGVHAMGRAGLRGTARNGARGRVVPGPMNSIVFLTALEPHMPVAMSDALKTPTRPVARHLKSPGSQTSEESRVRARWMCKPLLPEIRRPLGSPEISH
jgi:hypothetical protein